MKINRNIFAFWMALAFCPALGGCSAHAGNAAAPTAAPTAIVTQTAAAPKTQYKAPAMAESVFDAQAAAGQDGVLIDTSHLANGYVAVSATADARLKFQTVYGDAKYTYDLPGDGTPQCFPLQSGDGTYKLRVMKNTTGNRYAELCAAEAAVTLTDEFQPYLRPSQLVDYSADSACVAKAAALAQGAADDAGVVEAVYAYIKDSIAYDVAKAATVEDGYLPQPDETLASGQGICFDYAALAAAMLRSQGIPTKLITGYVSPENIYHAWNMIWLQEAGWVTVNIETPARQWGRVDFTFAASGADGSLVGDGVHYTDRYTY